MFDKVITLEKSDQTAPLFGVFDSNIKKVDIR